MMSKGSLPNADALEPTLPKKYLLKTLGCKANLYDSQLIEAELQKRGWVAADSDSEEAGLVDLAIVNSCTVTDEADRQSRKMATRLGKVQQKAKVVLTGCGAEVDPEKLSKTPGVDYIIGNQNKPSLVDLVLQAIDGSESLSNYTDSQNLKQATVLGGVENYGEMISRHPMDRDWPAPEKSFFTPPAGHEGEAARTRAFLKIQEGCNSFCTYCVIPYGRGPNRSLRIPEVVQQVKTLVSQGVREVVVTGTNIGDYGTDWAPTLQHVELFKAILAETSLERLRVSSLDPTEITPDLIELMKRDTRLCPHFHVSLQSVPTRVLRTMKRKYGFEEVKACLDAIAEIPAPAGGVFVGMDIITGFPTESREEFDWGVEQLKQLQWSRLHVFPYSERSGTPATRLKPSVPHAERVRRGKVLRELSFERLKSLHERTLAELKKSSRPLQRILLEGGVKAPDGRIRWIAGYTPNYLRVLLPLAQQEVPHGAEADFIAKWSNQIVDALPLELVLDRDSGDIAIGAKWLSRG
jgi:threonylcarbamoyladenosine tRNA methylthiotransferase MtaB